MLLSSVSSLAAYEPLQIALANLQHHIEAAGAKITVNELPTLPTHRTQMVMVFQNLIGNAIKYRGQEEPLIRIDAVKRDGQWQVSVSDNGQGFPPDKATRIFEPFRRLHGGKIPGSGIGLATCKRVIERLGRKHLGRSRGREPAQRSTPRFQVPDGGFALQGRRRLRARKTNKRMKSAEMMSPPANKMDHPSVRPNPPYNSPGLERTIVPHARSTRDLRICFSWNPGPCCIYRFLANFGPRGGRGGFSNFTVAEGRRFRSLSAFGGMGTPPGPARQLSCGGSSGSGCCRRTAIEKGYLAAARHFASEGRKLKSRFG